MFAESILVTVPLNDFRSLIAESINQSINQAFNDFKKTTQTEHPEQTDLITIKEVCELLHISPVTVHEWKKKGLLTFYRINRRVFFKKSEVLESLRKIGK